MKEKLEKILNNPKYIFALFTILAIIASVQALTGGFKTYSGGTIQYTQYNNYVIFKQSFYHLLEGKDLYILYPEEHWDLYKYTPTFSIFFGLFALLPNAMGLSLWNLLNALVLVGAVYYLPKLNNMQKALILLFLIMELMTCIQNEQSNALIAGLLIFALGLLERRHYWLAVFCIVSSAFIKLFGIVGFALLLFYPNKFKLGFITVIWGIILAAIPLLFVDYIQYQFLLQSYLKLLTEDHTASYGLSVMGWLYTWFGLDIDKNWLVLSGILGFLLPLIRFQAYKHPLFRYLCLCSVLIWVVIFNHKAESPTFIIAMAGVVLWFLASPKNWINITLFVSAVLLTSMSPTDLFPRFVREEWIKPYTLKAVPCILIWMKIIYDMLFTEEIEKDNRERAFNISS